MTKVNIDYILQNMKTCVCRRTIIWKKNTGLSARLAKWKHKC